MLRTLAFVCAVTAVTTATPRTFMSYNARRSREMPAPPLESEPPMTSTVAPEAVRFGFSTSVSRCEQRDVVVARRAQPRGRAPCPQAGAATEHDAGFTLHPIAQPFDALGRETHTRRESRHRRFLLTAQLDGD